MASFNEWLNRRDEAFHQDRFDRAMEKMAGRELFDETDKLDFVIKQFENMIGQLTRVEDTDVVKQVAELLKKMINNYRFGKPEFVAKAANDFRDAMDFIRQAAKGKPDPSKTHDVTEIQRLLDVISNQVKEAKNEKATGYADRHSMKYGTSGTEVRDDVRNAISNFNKAAGFRRNPDFSPSGPLYGDRRKK